MERELRQMFEVKGTEMTVSPTLSHELRNRIGRQRMVIGGFVAAALIAVVLGGFAGARSLSSDEALPPANPDSDETEEDIEQVPIIRQVIEAINTRDTDGFIDSFRRDDVLGDAGFAPRGIFVQGCILLEIYMVEAHAISVHEKDNGCLPPGDERWVAQEEEVRAWMAINQAWEVEAELIACREVDNSTHRFLAADVLVRCEVTTRWHTLSLEIREGWFFEFVGQELAFVRMSGSGSLIDLDPRERALPLSYDGLQEWERWVAANDPDDAARYLNPRVTDPPDVCGEIRPDHGDYLGCPQWDEAGPTLGPLLWPAKEGWSIDGSKFRPDGLIPYNPAFAAEIEASIQEYLEGR
ncbi:MAG: hypothetical protein M3198_08350 [Actinomycetota bacterium]|nr:hypothetical protein [Actinomycetota bacterium]